MEYKRVAAQGIEFWTSLAEEELARKTSGRPCANYIEQNLTDLMTLVITALQKIEISGDDEDEEEDWGAQISAGCCLSAFAPVAKNMILAPVALFAG